MARYVLPVVGAVVGFIYGGPAGASLGWSLGAAVGGLVDPQVIKGPSVGDIAQQTSQEGVPRPIVYGLSQPIAGNVIVSGEPKIVKKKKSGKGGPKVETESVFRTYAIRICEGPIGSVLRVWKNNRLVYDLLDPGMSQDNAKFLKTARFFLGSFAQNPSPDLEAVAGVGTTPAHRGTAYMVMASDDLTDMRGAIPQFQFQVTTLSIGQIIGDGDGWEYQYGPGVIVPPDPATFPVPTDGWNAPAPTPFGFLAPDTVWDPPPDPPAATLWPPGGWIWIRRTFYLGLDDGLQLTLTAENSGFVYWDGEYIGAHNPTNSQGGNGTSIINIPEELATPGEHTIAIYGLDEFPTPGNSDTYFRVLLNGSGSDQLLLSSLVSQVCEAAGMEPDMYDVTELTDVVAGLTVINTYPAYTILQSLSQVFFFLPSNYDGVLHFIKGGGNSVATITEDDMVDDEEDIEQTQRDDSIAVPRVMHLLYYDVDGGLAADKQTSERAGDRRAIGEQTMQSAVMMYSTQAAQAVAINHKVSIEMLRGSLRFCLPDNWLSLVPANPVVVQWNGRSERCIITKLEVLDGYQQYELYHDRQSSYTSIVEGIPAAPQTPPPSNIVGPTLIEPLDIHVLRDADDNAGLLFYAAISGTQPAWTGALIELSLDGGLNYIDSMSSDTDSIMGVLEAALPDHPQAFPDLVHTLAVNIVTPYAEFDEYDLAGLLNKANLAIVGDELIQFGQADEVSEGHWELSLLLRGRKGSQTQSHAIGTRFVLLEPTALGIIPASIADIGRTYTFRATSFSESEDTATVVSMTYTGQSQREREPSYLRARVDGSNAIVTWQGVGRLGSGARVAHGARFTGYHVIFEGSGTGDVAIEVDTAETSITQDISSLSQPIRIAVSQVNNLTGRGPEIQVYV